MNKKGFTLVELLAVIVILGLIAVILVPKVQGIVRDSKKNAAYENADRLVKTFEEYYVRKNIGSNFVACSYDFTNNVNLCDDYSFNGDKPKGQVSVSSGGNISGTVIFNGYKFNIENGKIVFVED